MKVLTAYIFLIAGISFGIIANGYFLKISDGFTKFLPSIIGIFIILLAYFSLAKAMQSIPVGFTYATYGGLTITAIAVFGLIKYNQMPNLYGILGISLIIIGVIILNTFGKTT